MNKRVGSLFSILNFSKCKWFPDQVPEVYKEMEHAGCTPDRKARQMLQVALMVLQQRNCE